ncbi:MauE/DoxX family redox-associated membrane protein [Chryseolinea sp. T2]|uniref:MauE/DoxX family redox-associated membrane protein n=1 Tax=Chryseolinea sp. T2 TaxID=3129255 RepID=UPI003076893A
MENPDIPVRKPWRQQAITRCIALGLIAGVLTSFRLWWKPSLFPTLPLPDIQFDDVNVLTAVLLLALSGVVISSKRMFASVAVLTLLCLMVLDQMKWQPWVYLYMIMLFPLVISARTSVISFAYWQLVMSGVYLWSGVHKMNPNFVRLFIGEVSGTIDIQLNPEQGLVIVAGYAVGLLEALAGVGLLFDKTRRSALCFVLVMHLAIIGYIGIHDRLQNNLVLVPWNVAMIIFNFLLFIGQAPGFGGALRQLMNNVRSQLAQVALLSAALVLVWIVPAFNLTGHVDHYLSFSLFSNKPSFFYVAIRDDQLEKIPSEIQKHSVPLAGMSGGKMIDIDLWAREELGVPFYPETRTFQKVSDFFCALGIEESGLVFLEIAKVGNEKKVTRFTCDKKPEPVSQ